MIAADDPRPAPKRWGIPFAWLVRVAVSAAILAVIFHFVPVAEVWREARALPPALWLGGLAIFLVGHAAAAAKWRLLIGPGIGFAEAFRAHLAGLAANLCLPSVAGGDVVRAGLVYRKAADRSRLAIGSVADRLLDTLGLAIIAVSGAIMASRFGKTDPTTLALLAVGLVAALAIGFASVLVLDRWLRRGAPDNKVVRLLTKATGAAAELARHPMRLLVCLVISMIVQLAFIGINIAFASAVHINAPPAAWCFAWASAKIIAILPISLGGLGVREASMAALLAPFGAEPARVVAIGLVWQTLLYSSGLIGLLVQLIYRPRESGLVAEPTP